MTVVNPDGTDLFERPMPQTPVRWVERQVRVRGEVVALARLRASARFSDAVEARFLRNQYLGTFAVSTTLVLLAMAGAWWGARHWVRPLRAVQTAAAHTARGEFGRRVEVGHRDAIRGDEIGDLVRNISHMSESLQRLEQVRRRWLADISHELRTPLAGLRGDIEALVDGVRPLEPKAVISLRDTAFQLSALVDDLHLLAMSDLQTLPCKFAEFDAIVLLRELVNRFEGRASAAGLALSVETNGLEVLPVQWDLTRIDQLLSNVLQNSLRYTSAPGRIVVSVRSSGNRAAIDIDDSAPAVPAADLPRLFEPLYRTNFARSEHRSGSGSGSGLGLAICEAIVKSHGG